MNVRAVLVLGLVLLSSRMAHAQADASVLDASGVDASVTDAAVPDAAPVPCGDVDALGTCQGDVRRACVNGGLVVEDCPASRGTGFTCVLEPLLGAATCELPSTDGGEVILDGGTSNAADAGTPLPPREESDGSNCVKPAWGPQAALALGLLAWPRRRRRRGDARGVKP